MDRLEAMALFIKVAECGSFSAASRALKVPLATVSRKVSDLENHLGTRLLVRTTRKLTLTDSGQTYLDSACRILEQVDSAERLAAGENAEPRGELVIAAPVMFGSRHITPLVSAFLQQHPAITVRLLLSDRNIDLVDEHADLAIRIGELPDSSMIATQVGVMRTVICASPALLQQTGVPQTAEALEKLPAILVESPFQSPSWPVFIAGDGSYREIQPSPRLRVSTTEAALAAACLGTGVVRLLHYQVADAIAAGQLNILLAGAEPEPVPVSILYTSRRYLPVKVRYFLDYAVPQLRQLLQFKRR